MRLAIMQPYLFPYIGYFQLINAVDRFVVYDDVAFIKQGWINRNNILLNEKKNMFSIPLINSSSFSVINEIYVSDKPYNWERKLLATIKQAYSKAPYFTVIFPMIEDVITGSANKLISDLAKNSVKAILDYLAIDTTIITSSSIYNNKDLMSVDRILDICKKENATIYINPIGGIDLYKKEQFSREGQELFFIKTDFSTYKQFNNEFIEGLSMIDVLMFNSVDEIKFMLNQFTLV
jgi:hypothetical protein